MVCLLFNLSSFIPLFIIILSIPFIQNLLLVSLITILLGALIRLALRKITYETYSHPISGHHQ
ncbi:UNVERIFIED_ORG: hypothetical protein ABIC97_001413 [Peribacillus simplex]